MKQHYFGLLLLAGILLSQVSSAQQLPTKEQESHPGGVKGVKAWFVTEQIPDRANYSRWVDKSGHGLQLMQGTTGAREFQEQDKEHNFHMSLWFHRNDVYFDVPSSSGRQLTTFGIFNPYNYSNEQPSEYLLYDLINYGNDQSFNMATDKLYTSGGAVHLDYGSEVGSDLWYRGGNYQGDNYSKYYTTKLLTHYKSVAPNYNIWGEPESLRIFINKDRSGTNKIWYFVPEFIVYDRHLRPLERLRVESYMARKYAMPLERSFLSSSGNLMWDYVEEADYNNRVFYVGREDSSGLYQPRAVSSYENYWLNNIEGNEGASETGYSSTSDNRHWNNRDRNRLLIFGIQELAPASYQQNGAYGGLGNDDYYMLGDDAGDLPIVKPEGTGLTGVNLSGRTWKMKTNVTPKERALVSWKANKPFVIKQQHNHHQLLFSGVEAGTEHRIFTGSAASYGVPSIEFDLATIRREHGGEIKIGFASNNGASEEVYYGLLIQEDGNVYTIEKGQRRTHIDGYTTIPGRKFKLSLEGNQLVVQHRYHLTGTGYPLSRNMALEVEDIAKLKYGLIHYKAASNLTSSEAETLLLSHLSTEGFVRHAGARTRLELRGAYNQIANRDNNGMQDLPNVDPRDNLTVWLLVDPTGKGDFSGDNSNVVYYKADEMTAYGKGKYLFDDVQWDKDGNGDDVFTFGYSRGSIVARVESFPYECDQNGTQTSEGYAKVYLEQGDSIYHAIDIYNSMDSLVYADSLFLREELEIPLEVGDYRVDITNKQLRETVSEEISILDYCEEQKPTEPEQPESNTGIPPVVLTVYPNPAQPNIPFNAETELDKPATVTYLLFNQLGVLIEQREGTYSSDFHKDQFTLPRVGVYIIKVITSDGKEINRKVLVN